MSKNKELQTYVKRNSSGRSSHGIISSFIDVKLQLSHEVPAAKLITENIGRAVDVVTYDVSALSQDQKARVSRVMKTCGWVPVLTTPNE